MVAGNVFYVPWPDFSEWNAVREQIFSPNVQDTITAYHTILMWKLKYDSVPAYIECTYTLLQVMVKEYEMSKNEQSSLLFNEHDLQLSYSTALIRFVNHVSSISSYKGETLYVAARTQNIPDWIINMRHDVAHGQVLPSLEALHIAAELSLKWLLDNYWGSADSCEQKSAEVTQFNVDSNFPQEVEVDAQNFFKKFLTVWELYHDTKYARVQFITEVEREFILHVEEMLSLHNVYFNNDVESTAHEEIQSIVNAYYHMEENGDFEPANLCKFETFKNLLIAFLKKIIKDNDSLKRCLVLSLLETSFLLENNFSPQKWQPVLWLLQEAGHFLFLLEVLFQIAGRGHKGAAKWLSAFPPAIRHLKKQWAMFKVLRKEHNNFKTKVLRKRVQKTCRPLEKLPIVLDVFKPPAVTLDMLKNVLLNPEHLTVNDIAEYLHLVKPKLMQVTLDMMKDLVSLHVVGRVGGAQEEEVKDSAEDKVFTVEDLEGMQEAEESLVFEQAVCEEGGWVKSSIDAKTWNKCPLGLLPFQVKVDCNLPEDLKWERKQTTRKRVSIPLLKHSVSMKKLREI